MPRNVLCPTCDRWITTARLKLGFNYCHKCQREIDAKRRKFKRETDKRMRDTPAPEQPAATPKEGE